jgi:hypothetical protein
LRIDREMIDTHNVQTTRGYLPDYLMLAGIHACSSRAEGDQVTVNFNLAVFRQFRSASTEEASAAVVFGIELFS